MVIRTVLYLKSHYCCLQKREENKQEIDKGKKESRRENQWTEGEKKNRSSHSRCKRDIRRISSPSKSASEPSCPFPWQRGQ
ncbi:hypothetical protein KOW79_020749 [Hemibagrus wyckioides]|uniref:Uncharacterized protein n=1 Tax=Hemibagrus wyckioides TaxID=337641 RepID=A0A9D3N6V6_9TELE|nr:hypothetical protein KOW79_020749 [Hemibagrus wyckioides]